MLQIVGPIAFVTGLAYVLYRMITYQEPKSDEEDDVWTPLD